MTQYAGVPFNIGGETYIVPALSLGQLRNGILAKLQEHDKLVEDGKLFETLTLRGEIILAAIKRNYPDFPEPVLWDHLDMQNTGPIWLAVLGASGMGETQAGAPTATLPATPGT